MQTTDGILDSKKTNENHNRIGLWLTRRNRFAFAVIVGITAFCLYTCIYALRKTFSAATFDNMVYFGVSFKVLLVLAQVFGYALSKFVGIKLISELHRDKRATYILSIAFTATFSWLGFAIVPAPINVAFLFINGLVLGLVWGIVFSYLEGRTVTEALGALLCVSFIFSSGLCRTVGSFLIVNGNVSEMWMPFVASCIFIVPLWLFLAIMEKVPPPSTADIELRVQRLPMKTSDRKKFVMTFLPGIILFVLAYMILTAFRDIRDNFSAEIWASVGMGDVPSIYTATEIPVSISVLFIIGAVMFVKDNFTALIINHVIIAAGMSITGLSTFLFEQQMIGPAVWMTLIGAGLYIGYVPFNSIFFDRLLAAFKYVGTVGFIMYLADSFGYLGSVSVLLIKEFGKFDLSWLDFLIQASYVVSGFGLFLITASLIYFFGKYRRWTV